MTEPTPVDPGSLGALSAEGVIAHLGLEYLEGEGVWIRVLWRTDYANAIYCLLTPDGFSALHRLREDEAWIHVAGAPVEQVVLAPDLAAGVTLISSELGHEAAVRVPAGCWQGARTTGEWSLVVCMLAPAFTGFELADASTDLAGWPAEAAGLARELIRA